eukprot:4509265-Prymnesium_polylepis.1
MQVGCARAEGHPVQGPNASPSFAPPPAQVVSMGAGAPMLGDLKKTNFDKPESEGGAALQFELEANNFDLNSREHAPPAVAAGTVSVGASGGAFKNSRSPL